MILMYFFMSRLFQQWIVDDYVKIEKDRIFYRWSNKTLELNHMGGLFMSCRTEQLLLVVIIFLSKFIRSPRNVLQLYPAAMADVRKYGISDLFITMKCPKWRKIEENLLPGRSLQIHQTL